MRIIVNGNEKNVTDPTNIATLLELIGVHPGQVVTEHNNDLIAPERYPDIYLSDGDRIELIQFVGGG